VFSAFFIVNVVVLRQAIQRERARILGSGASQASMSTA
jgi:hypothetical protein